MEIGRNVYGKLFMSTFYLSAFTFGGGYVIVPLMKKQFADKLQWIEEEEMINLVSIAQSSPGAVAVNASILIGYRMAGLGGAMIAILGTVLPPLIILSVISTGYTAFKDNPAVNVILKGMQAGVAAVICDVVAQMVYDIIRDKRILSILIMLVAFLATTLFQVNIILVILVCGILGVLAVNRDEKAERGPDHG